MEDFVKNIKYNQIAFQKLIQQAEKHKVAKLKDDNMVVKLVVMKKYM